MNVLEITPEKSEKMSKAEDSALDIIQAYFDGKRPGGDDIKIAQNYLNTVKGNRQTHTAREALKFNMVSLIADEKQMKKYVSSTCPEIKKITGDKP